MRTCADSISLASLQPVAAQFDLLAGYDDGAWPDAQAITQAFPGKTVVRITTSAADDQGDMLDVEQGDASPADAPGWVQRRRAAGHLGPLVYGPESSRAAIVAAFNQDEVPLPGLWIAAYPGVGKKLQQPGDVGHQWANFQAQGYDASVVVDYLPGIDPPPFAPNPLQEVEPMPIRLVVNGVGQFVWNTAGRQVIPIPDPTDAGTVPNFPVWIVDQAQLEAIKSASTTP